MKRLWLLVLGLLLVGCQPHQSEDQTETSLVETTQETHHETSEEAQATPEGSQGRQAWTDYAHYAAPNEEGYAYQIYNDPSFSSEVYPITDSTYSKVLLFTFDDAPQMPNPYALEIAKTLKAKDVNAIFLVNGMYLETEEGRRITKEIYDLGFEIGNHTQTHPNLHELDYDQEYAEISQTSQLVEEITGEKPRWFRPPFGLYTKDTIAICNELGMQLMTWNFGYDWMDEYLDAQALVNISLTTHHLHDGANVLMHDRSWTLEALDQMIDGYREMGYQIVDPLLIESRENILASES